MVGTFWSLVPAVVAIALALITKEVYSSLFIGVLIGTVFFTIGAPEPTLGTFFTRLFKEGFVAKLSDPYNVGILIFLIVLGIMVALMNKAGGSAAFGAWAQKNIKSKMGAELATIALGILIFIDDYFNCLTVGSVMKPVTDRYRVSPEKLSYLIDSTAAPVCIIAPISSWAAAVSGFVPKGENGLSLFIQAIPYNFYALLTLFFLIALTVSKTEFGPMQKFSQLAEMATGQTEEEKEVVSAKGTMFDLIFPVALLMVFCTLGMIYSGGYFTKGDTYGDFVQAFANSDASVGLVIGSFTALLLTIISLLARRVLNLTECMDCVPDGFKAMVPAILILTLAWTLKGTTDALGAKDYVSAVVGGSAAGFKMFLPAIIFVIACFLAFATGTSWGTFGILIPICIAVFPDGITPLRVISISACMAGAVCGDHCSPISDTTIMASAGARCKHVNHVSTQLPYAVTVAVVSFFCYIVAGLTHSAVLSLLLGMAALSGILYFRTRK